MSGSNQTSFIRFIFTITMQETLYHIKQGYIVENIADQYVLVAPAVGDIDYSKMLVLSESAALIVNRLLNESLSFDNLVNLLLDEYEVERGLVTQELTELIAELERLNILEIPN